MLAFQIIGVEIDGELHNVNPSCFRDFTSDEGAFGLYNVWVRFTTPGSYDLKIVARQVRDFYFVYPFDVLGIPDPLGLDGRRVFVRGELVGSPLDGLIVHSYELQVSGD